VTGKFAKPNREYQAQIGDRNGSVPSRVVNISSAELPPQGAQVGNFAIELGAARCLRLLSTHQRTLECSSPVTAMGQQRTHAAQQTAGLFDHLVGAQLAIPAQLWLGGIV
jgi:hypothetical protein